MKCNLIDKKILIFLVLSLGLSSCTQGIPVVELLSFNRPLIEFKTTFAKQRFRQSSSAIEIFGHCNSDLANIEISFNQGQSFLPVENFTSQVQYDCSLLGTFKLTLQPPLTGEFIIAENQFQKKLIFKALSKKQANNQEIVLQDFNLILEKEISLPAGTSNQIITTASGEFRLNQRISRENYKTTETSQYLLKSKIKF